NRSLTRRELGCDLENRPATVSAAHGCCPVDIAGCIEGQARPGSASVCALVVEAMQYLLRPTPACFGGQLEHCAAVRGTPSCGRAIKISGGIEDQACQRIRPIRAIVVEVMQYV